MDEFVEKFTNLLHYVTYIKEDRSKVWRFLNYLLVPYKERIEFYNPNSIDEVVRKARLCYHQFKNASEGSKPLQVCIKLNLP